MFTPFQFRETSRHISEDHFMASFHLENDYYRVTLHYVGDYQADKAAGTLDPGIMSATIKPKQGALLLTAHRSDISIHDPCLIDIYPEDAARVIMAIREAARSARELQSTITQYLT